MQTLCTGWRSLKLLGFAAQPTRIGDSDLPSLPGALDTRDRYFLERGRPVTVPLPRKILSAVP